MQALVAPLALGIAAYTFLVVKPKPAGLKRLLWAVPVLPIQALLPWCFDQHSEPVFLAITFCIVTWLGLFRVLSLCAGRGVLSSPWCHVSFPRFLLALLMPLHLGPPLMETELEADTSNPSSNPSSAPSFISSFGHSPLRPAPPPDPHLAADSGASACTNNIVRENSHTGSSGYSSGDRSIQQECARLLLQSTGKGVLYYFIQELFMRPGVPQVAADAAFLIGLFLFITVIMETLSVLVLLATGNRIKPHFNRPYLATSFRNFWAQRWNLTVSNCFRQAVYEPALEALLGPGAPVGPTGGQPGNAPATKGVPAGKGANRAGNSARSERHLGKRAKREGLSFQTSRLLAMTLTFFVSGVAHEVAVYYLASTVTGEMMAFFMLQPLLIAAELALRKAGFTESVPDWIACPFVVGTLFLLAHCLFLPPFSRLGATARVVAHVRSWFER